MIEQAIGGFMMAAVLYYVLAPWWITGKPGWRVKWRLPFEGLRHPFTES